VLEIKYPLKKIKEWKIATLHKRIYEKLNPSSGNRKHTIGRTKLSNRQTRTAFKISIEKTKSIMFSRKNTAIASRPRLDIWIKRTKIEQVRKHQILGLMFDSRMNWNEHKSKSRKK
jgi:hypothetical protein